MAAVAGVTVMEAETYLRWWCGQGCPGAETGGMDDELFWHDSGSRARPRPQLDDGADDS
jgi:hypothetical protein